MSTVDQTTTDTAAMVRRMVRRTLTVIGGTVAGTAIAWAISSASASAEPACNLTPLTPGVEQLADGQVSDVVCAVGRLVPAPAIINVGTGAKSAADEFGRLVADEFRRVPAVPIDLGEFGRGDRPGADTTPGGGTHEPPSLVRPVGEHSAAAPASTYTHRSLNRLAAGSATDRALGDGMTRRGSPEPAPIAPTAPVPAAPATVPASGSGGHPSGGGDSPTFAALGLTGRQFDLTRGQTLAATEALSFGEPGAQPGVTPD
jgi:hypothetical protein